MRTRRTRCVSKSTHQLFSIAWNYFEGVVSNFNLCDEIPLLPIGNGDLGRIQSLMHADPTMTSHAITGLIETARD